MPADRFGREIDYLRISVIDHCNLRCVYCMPLRGLTLRALARAADRGGDRDRRPRRGGGRLPQVPPDRRRADAARPTSSRSSARIAAMRRASQRRRHDHQRASCCRGWRSRWRAAGLRRLNIHVDTFHPERLKKIMRFGTLEEIEAGIAAAEEAGLRPIKINCVVTRDYNDMDVVGHGAPRARARLARALHRADAARRRRDRARRAVAVRALARRPAQRIEAALGPLAAAAERQPLGRVAELPLRARARASSASSAR